MKKILAIALTLTLILALAVMPTSAASLSSNWTEIWNMVDGCGELVVDNDGSIYFDSEIGGFHGGIGVTYNEKVAVDGLEIHIKLENLTGVNTFLPATLGQLISVNLSADKATDFVPYSVNGTAQEPTADWKNPNCGFATGLDVKCLSTAAVTFTQVGNDETYGIFGGMTSAIKIGYDAVVGDVINSGDEFLLKFVVDGENVKVLVNGAELGVTFLAADVLDAEGKAYLSFSNQGFGTSHAALIVKYINGVAANDWAGEAGSCAPITPDEPETPSEPAPSEPESSIVITPPAENKGGCGNNA
ncbi:MAG: hypothetical protein IKA51_05295 [Clostridia bacterium]|nr:hypothetical protein [Clostridia bacterium]